MEKNHASKMFDLVTAPLSILGFKMKNDEAVDDASTNETAETAREAPKLHSAAKLQNISDEDLANLKKALFAEIDFIPARDRKAWALDKVRAAFDRPAPETLIELIAAHAFDGDTGTGIDVRPDWLDMDKFGRGQRFARDFHTNIVYAELLSMYTYNTIPGTLKSLMFTGGSSTPYTSFQRYLRTIERVYGWYTSDLWRSGSAGHNDVRAVRRIHALVKKRMDGTSEAEMGRKTSIDSPLCPKFDAIQRDFQSAAGEQCHFVLPDNGFGNRNVNQADMILTQFIFTGLLIWDPKFFGVHHDADEDLEAFCHLWRCIGYLIGIDDDFNFCRGTLEEVRARTKDYIDYWIKPNLQTITPSYLHMTSCGVVGATYYFPLISCDATLLEFSDVMKLDTPRIYDSMSYSVLIKRYIIRLYFDYASKVSSIRSLINTMTLKAIEKARNFDEKTRKKLQENSDKTLADFAMRLK